MHQNLGYLIAVEFARMETTNSAIPDTSFLVLKIGDCDDLDFWQNKAKNFTKAFSSISDSIRNVMKAPTHVKSEDKFIFGHFLAALHWQHVEKEINEVPKGVYNVCLQGKIQKKLSDLRKQIYSSTE